METNPSYVSGWKNSLPVNDSQVDLGIRGSVADWSCCGVGLAPVVVDVDDMSSGGAMVISRDST